MNLISPAVGQKLSPQQIHQTRKHHKVSINSRNRACFQPSQQQVLRQLFNSGERLSLPPLRAFEVYDFANQSRTKHSFLSTDPKEQHEFLYLSCLSRRQLDSREPYQAGIRCQRHQYQHSARHPVRHCDGGPASANHSSPSGPF